jgi:hypothetical protein
MDLGHVIQRLPDQQDQTAFDWIYDMRLIWSNAMTFHEKVSPVSVLATELSPILERAYETFSPTRVNVWYQRLREVADKLCTILGSFEILDRYPVLPDPRGGKHLEFMWVRSVFDHPRLPGLDYRIPMSDSEETTELVHLHM